MSIKRDLEFLYEIGTLRFLQRKWIQFLHADVQNIAEHKFRVIWIALVIAKNEKVKHMDKVIKMALIHDVAESRTGDADYVARQYNTRDEEVAIHDMLHETALADEFIELWEEYEARKTIEAKIVKDADNIDVDLELREQAARGHALGSVWSKMRKKVTYKSLFTQSAKKLWMEIQRSNPHDWHLNARNRYNSGDWKQKAKKK
jgi:putative hydrolases of HD superfamily